MIKEIVQFVETLPEEVFTKNLQLKEGVYIFLDVEDENGKAVLKNIDPAGQIVEDDCRTWTSKIEWSSFFKKCLDIQLNTMPVSPKKIFNPDKKIFNSSCSPFALAFTKRNFNKEKNTRELLADQLKNQYFKAAEKFLFEDAHKTIFYPFRNFLIKNLYDFLKGIPAYKDAKDTFSINIYCKKASFGDFVSTHLAYLKENVFNKAQYNVNYNGRQLGISDSLSGFNDKKRFLQHKSGFTDLNYRITGDDAQSIWKFFKLQQNKQLPKPTPVFVDRDELDLNTELVRFYQDDKIFSYSKLIQTLLDRHKRQLHNFYLIFFQGGVIDVDFVPVFHYEVRRKITLELFKIGGKFNSLIIQNVFNLLYEVLNKAFNNQLIQNTNDGGVWLKFFDELEANPKYNFTDGIVNLMYKYRKAIYDYIYKSRHQAITCAMFDDIMLTSIVDDLCHDVDFNRDYAIKEKLNIWFNFWDYFANNETRINMANRTVEISNRLKSIAGNENEHIQTNEEFAFAAGQLISKILTQSKSANRSHALLEPFLQKVEPLELKKAIARAFDTYKHEFKMYPRKYPFDKLMSEVMGFESGETNMKNLIHMVLAGYFTEWLFKKDTEIENNEDQ